MLIKNNYEEISELIPKRIDPLTEAEVVAFINNTKISERQFLKNHDAMVAQSHHRHISLHFHI